MAEVREIPCPIRRRCLIDFIRNVLASVADQFHVRLPELGDCGDEGGADILGISRKGSRIICLGAPMLLDQDASFRFACAEVG